MTFAAEVRFESVHCKLVISRPGPALVLVVLSGRDVGEFGRAPFSELQKDLVANSTLQLFIDARDGTGATLDVSGEWATWLRAHKDQLSMVSMLTGSPFIQLSADLVRQFSGLEDKMRIYTDASSFDRALAAAR